MGARAAEMICGRGDDPRGICIAAPPRRAPRPPRGRNRERPAPRDACRPLAGALVDAAARKQVGAATVNIARLPRLVTPPRRPSLCAWQVPARVRLEPLEQAASAPRRRRGPSEPPPPKPRPLRSAAGGARAAAAAPRPPRRGAELRRRAQRPGRPSPPRASSSAARASPRASTCGATRRAAAGTARARARAARPSVLRACGSCRTSGARDS